MVLRLPQSLFCIFFLKSVNYWIFSFHYYQCSLKFCFYANKIRQMIISLELYFAISSLLPVSRWIHFLFCNTPLINLNMLIFSNTDRLHLYNFADTSLHHSCFKKKNLPSSAVWKLEGSLQAYHGHAQALEVLLQQGGTEVDQQDEAGRTPLVLAALRGHTDCVHTLLSQGASPCTTTTHHGQTAVHHAGW